MSTKIEAQIKRAIEAELSDWEKEVERMQQPRPTPADVSGPLKEILELAMLQPPLLGILRQVLSLWPVSTAFLTSALRTPKEDAAVGGSGLHVLGRAVDLRTRDLPGGHRAVYPIAEEINRRWAYDPKRPHKVVAYTVPHGTGPHLHLQVHPNTTEMGEASS